MTTIWPSVTVTVLTWNGERYLEAILSAVEAQRYDGAVDVLVIDSGSTDRTLAIVGDHPSVRLHEIQNSEFGHGRTRQLAAELAVGELVAYLTHDAVPIGDSWLQELVRPLAEDDRVAAVVGKQVARPSAPPVLKYDIRRVFERLGPDDAVTVVHGVDSAATDAERATATFYSDANSMTRREVLLGPVPYRDVDYAEDQQFGRDVLAAGFFKAYASLAAVEHSNDTTLRTFGSRIAADVTGLRKLGTPMAPVSRARAIAQFLRWSLADAGAILRDPDYGVGAKLHWWVVNPWYHAAKWSAYRRAVTSPLE